MLTGFTEGDAAYGPVQVQELNHKANGVELVFYINSDPGKPASYHDRSETSHVSRADQPSDLRLSGYLIHAPVRPGS